MKEDPGRAKATQPLTAADMGPAEHIQEALRLLSVISVRGDAVDVLAGAKAHLRDACWLIGQEKEAEDNG